MGPQNVLINSWNYRFMISENNNGDRRKCKRFKARNGAFAVLMPAGNKLGQIKNISISGLAFNYVETWEGSGNEENPNELKLFLADRDFIWTNFHLR
jgi:hypothetical protein